MRQEYIEGLQRATFGRQREKLEELRDERTVIVKGLLLDAENGICINLIYVGNKLVYFR